MPWARGGWGGGRWSGGWLVGAVTERGRQRARPAWGLLGWVGERMDGSVPRPSANRRRDPEPECSENRTASRTARPTCMPQPAASPVAHSSSWFFLSIPRRLKPRHVVTTCGIDRPRGDACRCELDIRDLIMRSGVGISLPRKGSWVKWGCWLRQCRRIVQVSTPPAAPCSRAPPSPAPRPQSGR